MCLTNVTKQIWLWVLLVIGTLRLFFPLFMLITIDSFLNSPHRQSRGSIFCQVSYWVGFPGSSDCKVSACNAGDLGLILGLGRSPGEGNVNPLQYSCLENSMDRETSLVGYSPWDCKELDTTEQLHFTSLYWEVCKHYYLIFTHTTV